LKTKLGGRLRLRDVAFGIWLRGDPSIEKENEIKERQVGIRIE
jgi:hypothetical protein